VQEVGLAPVDRCDPHLDVGVKGGEPAEARHQPPDCEGRGCRDGEDADPVLVADAFAGKEDAVETGAGAFEERPAVRRQFDAAMPAFEQPRAKMVLKGADLVADGTLREGELVGGAGERKLPGNSFESA
jgi:hypothetical protein